MESDQTKQDQRIDKLGRLEMVRKVLTRSNENICNNLDPKPLLGIMLSREALTPDNVTDIKSKVLKRDQSAELLGILRTKQEKSYIAFMDALLESEIDRKDIYDSIEVIERDVGYIRPRAGSRIKEADLNEIIQKLGGPAELKKFYTHLELTDAEIEKAIYGADTNDIELQARAVLRKWIQRKGRDATKEWVIRALNSSENENAAQGLQDHWNLRESQSSTDILNRSGTSRPKGDDALASEPSRERHKTMGTEKQLSLEATTSRDETEISALYDVQLEVALPAMEGRNTMILMPTGAGKTTVVAAAVIEKVINKADDPIKCKVIFIVPTKPLVKQQLVGLNQRLRLSKKIRITGLHEDYQAITLKHTLEVYNVVVLTAAILDNALKDKNNPIDIHTLSLLVFDECHLCMQDHVYNSIMKHYHYEKFNNPDTCNLPQIVAMTATTPGTGKAKSQDAEDHVFQLICNLNAPYISVVEQNKMNPICVEPRAKDPFKDEVRNIMISIEDMMKNTQAGSLLTELKFIPSDKKSQVYMQWLSNLEMESGKQLKDGELCTIQTCSRHSRYYYVSLLINAEVRTKDALKYLNSIYEGRCTLDQMESYSKTDFALLEMFTCKRKAFREYGKNPECDNPLLKTLKDIILREYQQRPESRALLFCQSVETTVALKTWIDETDSLRFLQPDIIVGCKGITSAQHRDILDKLKDGRHKLLVSTYELEEAIDVAEFNLVIRLNYVPNDTGHVAAGHVQSKGGGQHSKCYLIASSENSAAWEIANKSRSEMSIRAIDNFRGMPEEELIEQMLIRQKKDYSQFKTEKETDFDEFRLLCGGCRGFACSATYIGLYKDTHHVVLNEQFLVEKTKLTPHHKPKKIDREIVKSGKIYCKECNKDWGILAAIRKQKLPFIKMVSFKIEKKEQETGKWINAKKIFHIKHLERQDLQETKMIIPEY